MNNNKEILTHMLSYLNLREYSDLRKIMFKYYNESLLNVADALSKQVSNFDTDEFLDSIHVEEIPFILGLNVHNYIIKLSNYIPNILVTYDEKRETFVITPL